MKQCVDPRLKNEYPPKGVAKVLSLSSKKKKKKNNVYYFHLISCQLTGVTLCFCSLQQWQLFVCSTSPSLDPTWVSWWRRSPHCSQISKLLHLLLCLWHTPKLETWKQHLSPELQGELALPICAFAGCPVAFLLPISYWQRGMWIIDNGARLRLLSAAFLFLFLFSGTDAASVWWVLWKL